MHWLNHSPDSVKSISSLCIAIEHEACLEPADSGWFTVDSLDSMLQTEEAIFLKCDIPLWLLALEA
ncbi:hypothetical protein LINPERHAP1_LOCUS11797, partial [Linum perenne]